MSGGTAGATNLLSFEKGAYFENNTALTANFGGGGALYIIGAANITQQVNFLSGTDGLSGTTFYKNEAYASGGAIALATNVTATFENTSFIENKATNDIDRGSGGAMHIAGGSTVFFDNASFVENYALVSGGGIYNQASTTTFAGSTLFSGNRVERNNGGGYILFANNASTTSLSSFHGITTFSENSALN